MYCCLKKQNGCPSPFFHDAKDFDAWCSPALQAASSIRSSQLCIDLLHQDHAPFSLFFWCEQKLENIKSMSQLMFLLLSWQIFFFCRLGSFVYLGLLLSSLLHGLCFVWIRFIKKKKLVCPSRTFSFTLFFPLGTLLIILFQLDFSLVFSVWISLLQFLFILFMLWVLSFWTQLLWTVENSATTWKEGRK